MPAIRRFRTTGDIKGARDDGWPTTPAARHSARVGVFTSMELAHDCVTKRMMLYGHTTARGADPGSRECRIG